MTPIQSDSRVSVSSAAGPWSHCEELIEAFERAWQSSPPPSIDDYLRGNHSARIELLVELVHADLEFRIKAGEAMRVESYLNRYPELASDDATVLELLEAEHDLRRRKDSNVGINEYALRFPALTEELRKRLSGGSTVVGTDETHDRSKGPHEQTSIPGYEIVKEIGRGGMGIIYQAKQARLKRHVALKFLPTDLIQDRSLLDRFVREAITASALNHPNICTIHELGEHEGRPFIVMEFIEGQTLRSVTSWPLNSTEVVRLIRQVARALAAAHAAGVVHRDIKPENIMVREDGYVKVLDFGLARRLAALRQGDTKCANDTTPGALLGTIAYMSPEQARGETLEPSSDIFSLGVIFYQLVTGRHPFESDSAISTLHAISTTHPLPPSHLNAEIQAGVDGIIESMLNKDARLRPSADAIEAALSSAAPRTQKRNAADAVAAIVHRGRELIALRAALAEAEAGHSRFICVTGEPGIGKTTIVEDFFDGVREEPTNYLIACGRCTERQTETEAFLPVIDALTSLIRDDVSGTTPRLMKVLAPTWHGQVLRSRSSGDANALRATSQPAMLREFCNFLEELSRFAPVILFVDDLHWADASTVDLLAYLGHHLHRLRLLVVVTFRPTEMLLGPHPFHRVRLDLSGRGVCSELPLNFLERQQVDGYLSAAFPNHAFPSDFAELIHTRTEGSPLFMVDLLRYLREQNVIQKVRDVCSLAREVPDFKQDLPESVRSMIQRKLEQLSNEDRRLLAAASVQGHEFDSTAVAAVVERDAETVEERLTVLQRVHGLVRLLREDQFPNRTPTQRFAFVHVLYQQALYAEITPTRRLLIQNVDKCKSLRGCPIRKLIFAQQSN